MDSNSWYYTLSAIPQTLGAVVAVSSAFGLYKMTIVVAVLDKKVESLRGLYGSYRRYGPEEIHANDYLAFDTITLLSECGKLVTELKKNEQLKYEAPKFEGFKQAAELELIRKNAIVGAVKGNLGINLLVISCSLLLLPFGSHFMNKNNVSCIGAFLVTAAAVAAALCVIKSVWVIFDITQS